LPSNHGAGVILVYPDLESLSQAAASRFVQQAQEAVTARGRFGAALAGGQTPRRTYELLGRPPWKEQAPWPRIHLFWGDERCVPRDDARSNARLAREVWLDKVPLPGSQVHPIECAAAPAVAAARYEATLREFFGARPPRLDLVFLGLGENGHTASLFPGTPVIHEQQRWAAAVYVAEQDLYRVTLTAAIINQAAVVVFLVTGRSKARVLQEVRQGAYDPERLPAQLIRPQTEELYWLVDQEAASLLE
jgi:6-phosphogluconolactonase